METEQIITTILGLLFVLGLALAVIALLKWLQIQSSNLNFCKKIKSTRRINIVEQRRLDAHNSIVMFEADNQRYLVLAGSNSAILLNQTKVKDAN